MTNIDSILKSRDITLPTKVCIVKAMIFPVVMYRHENWPIKKAEHQRIDVFKLLCWRRLLRVPWIARIKPVNPKENQPWIFIGRTDAEAKAPIHWPPYVKSQLMGKDPNAGKDSEQEKGATEDEMTGWYYQLNRHEFKQTPEDSEGQGSLVCCSPWVSAVSHKMSDTTYGLNNNHLPV